MKLSFGIIAAAVALWMVVGLTQAAQEDQYHIKAGDRLDIVVHDNTDLTMSVTVLADGTISYPLVGNLYVSGLTTAGLQDILTQKLSTYLQKPIVAVSISTETVDKIYVLGEVRSPNAYPYEAGYRLTDYLAVAGGPGENANWNKCYVYSTDPAAPKRIINLKNTFQSRDLTQNPVIKPNDTIYLERRSGFSIISWGEIGQVFGIVLSITTLYFVLNRR